MTSLTKLHSCLKANFHCIDIKSFYANHYGVLSINRKACTQFIGLWKQKHETGQWIEVEPEAMSARSEFPPFNPSGIMFMGDSMKQTMETMSVSNRDASEDASKAGIFRCPNTLQANNLIAVWCNDLTYILESSR